MHRLITPIALLLTFLLTACAPHPPLQSPPPIDTPLTILDGTSTYQITRHRPAHVGDSFDVLNINQMAVQTTLSVAGKPPETQIETKRYELLARALVKAVDSNGRPTALTLTVTHCIGPRDVQLPAQGAIVNITFNNSGASYTLPNGTKLSDDAETAFQGLRTTGGVGSGAAFDYLGPDQPHHVGDSWPLSIAPDARQRLGESDNGQVTDMHAQTSLTALQILDGIKSAQLDSSMTGVLKLSGIPWGFTPGPADLKMSQTLLCPLDPSLPLQKSERDLLSHVTLSGSILFVPITIKMTMLMHQTITPVLSSTTKP